MFDINPFVMVIVSVIVFLLYIITTISSINNKLNLLLDNRKGYKKLKKNIKIVEQLSKDLEEVIEKKDNNI